MKSVEGAPRATLFVHVAVAIGVAVVPGVLSAEVLLRTTFENYHYELDPWSIKVCSDGDSGRYTEDFSNDWATQAHGGLSLWLKDPAGLGTVLDILAFLDGPVPRRGRGGMQEPRQNCQSVKHRAKSENQERRRSSGPQ